MKTSPTRQADPPPGVSCYWAAFERRGGHVFRFDTRIYGEAVDGPHRRHRPLGCIIGKNPGSALPLRWDAGALVPITLGNDRFLPTVRSVVRKAHAVAGVPWPPDRFVQVLNLFYLCNRDLRQARESLLRLREAPACPAERRRLPWAWFAWGGADGYLDPLKARFQRRRWPASVFIDGQGQAVAGRSPDSQELARHTQGMRHGAAVAALASLIAEPRKP